MPTSTAKCTGKCASGGNPQAGIKGKLTILLVDSAGIGDIAAQRLPVGGPNVQQPNQSKAMKFIKLAILAAAASLFASACSPKAPTPAPAPPVIHHGK
ncbi:MAG: hypothetical protein WCK77_02810 [Verrucomicrobiota bacterium]